jgi:large subunit ribosomal protein L5
MQRFGYKNTMQVPRLQKIVVNMGMGDAISNSKLLDAARDDMRQITGQQPVITKAKKSIANFKLREGMSIGCRVTLRGPRMYEFFDRLVNVALPRIRDFRGVPTKSFDGRGNYTLGLKEQINFPEIDYDKIMQLMGMDITFVTSARTDEESRELLAQINMPCRKSCGRGWAPPPAAERWRAPTGVRRGQQAGQGRASGDQSAHRQDAGEAEVQGAAAQPLQPVWEAPRLPARFRNVPHLFP